MDLQMQAFDDHLDFYLALNSYTTLRERTDHYFNQHALSDCKLQWPVLSFICLLYLPFCLLFSFHFSFVRMYCNVR